MSARSKGRGNELKARDILLKAGYDVQMVQRSSSRYAKQVDLFGLWDLMAVRASDIRFVQVKTNRKVYGALREPYELWECPPGCTKELWTFYDGKPRDPVIEIL